MTMSLPNCVALAVLVALMLTTHGADAASQKVFRCGPDGRIYSQTPCKDGYEVNAADQRSGEQRKAAEDVVKREEKLADKMTRERQAKEAAAAKQGPTIIATPAPTKPAAASASSPATKKKRPPKKPAQA
ncbi:MAG: hypothetical protein V4792_09200 [Pseudomonadota bacterium]